MVHKPRRGQYLRVARRLIEAEGFPPGSYEITDLSVDADHLELLWSVRGADGRLYAFLATRAGVRNWTLLKWKEVEPPLEGTV